MSVRDQRDEMDRLNTCKCVIAVKRFCVSLMNLRRHLKAATSQTCVLNRLVRM